MMRSLCFSVACSLAGASAASAALYTTNFDGASGDPAGWVDPDSAFALNGAGQYTSSHDSIKEAYWNGIASNGAAASSLTDYTVTTTFTINDDSTPGWTNVYSGVMGRYTPTGTSTGFYLARWSGGSGSAGSFRLFDVALSGTARDSIGDTTLTASLSAGVTYTLTLSMSGSTISATLSGGSLTPLNISGTDATLTSGTAGIRGPDNDAEIANIAFDSFTIVPEPAAASLLIALSGLPLARRTRRA
jgi:hypothetical protein